MTEQEEQYRRNLVELEQKSQAAYDRTSIYLSAGAMAVSLNYFTHVVEDGSVRALPTIGWAWTSWTLALIATFASFLFSTLAMRRSIERFDAGDASPRLGGALDTAVEVLNWASILLFLIGTVLAGCFLYNNL